MKKENSSEGESWVNQVIQVSFMNEVGYLKWTECKGMDVKEIICNI